MKRALPVVPETADAEPKYVVRAPPLTPRPAWAMFTC